MTTTVYELEVRIPRLVAAGMVRVYEYLDDSDHVSSIARCDVAFDGTILFAGQPLVIVEFKPDVTKEQVNEVLNNIWQRTNRASQLSTCALERTLAAPMDEVIRMETPYAPLIAPSHWNSLEVQYAHQGGLRFTNTEVEFPGLTRTSEPSTMGALPADEQVLNWHAVDGYYYYYRVNREDPPEQRCDLVSRSVAAGGPGIMPLHQNLYDSSKGICDGISIFTPNDAFCFTWYQLQNEKWLVEPHYGVTCTMEEEGELEVDKTEVVMVGEEEEEDAVIV